MKANFSYSQLTCALIAAFGLVLSGCHMNFHMADGYTFTNTGDTAESTEQGKFSEGITAIDVVNQFGNIKIEVAGGEPGWKWDSKVWADSPELAELLIDELAMDVQTDGQKQTWQIVLPEPTPDLNGVQSNLTLMVPSGVKVNLENSHGDLFANQVGEATISVRHGDSEVKSATGNISISSSHGDVKAGNIAGALTIDASHTDIEVDQVDSHGILKTSHGDIVATNVYGDVKAKNSHGSTRISTSGENVSVNSQHGRVDLSVASNSFKSIDIETTHSSVNVDLPAGANPTLDMEANHGDIKSEFESAVGSDQRIKLRTNHGDIRVTKQATVTAEAL